MKRHLLKSCDSNLKVVLDILMDIKFEDVKSRHDAKPSHKPKWTRSIKKLNEAIDLVVKAKRTVRAIPKRV